MIHMYCTMESTCLVLQGCRQGKDGDWGQVDIMILFLILWFISVDLYMESFNLSLGPINIKWLSLKCPKHWVTLFGAVRTHNFNFHVLQNQGKTLLTKKVVRTAVYTSLLSHASSKITLFYFFFEFVPLIVAVWFDMPSVSNLTKSMSHVICY